MNGCNEWSATNNFVNPLPSLYNTGNVKPGEMATCEDEEKGHLILPYLQAARLCINTVSMYTYAFTWEAW